MNKLPLELKPLPFQSDIRPKYMASSDNRMIQTFQMLWVNNYLFKSYESFSSLRIIQDRSNNIEALTLKQFFSEKAIFRIGNSSQFKIQEPNECAASYSYIFNRLKWRIEKHCLGVLYTTEVVNQYFKFLRLVEAWPRMKYYLRHQKAWITG